MILSFSELYLKYTMNIKGVIHIGAHHAEEVPVYINNGITDIVLFEPLEENFNIIEKTVSGYNANIIGHQVALGNENKFIEMHLSSNQLESSSILKPKKHLELYPDITFDKVEMVEMKKLDDYNFIKYNFLNIDVQGYELEVLKGAEKTLKYIDYVYCEVNKDEIYENNAYLEDIDEYLSKFSFRRIETNWWEDHNWGDALYIKGDLNEF
jgi:FkbM family methyltransferase